MRWRLLAVLTLVALAGCSGFSGFTDPPPPTTTPAPVPTITESVQTPSAPAGISESGLDGVGFLANGHQRALSNHSYTFHERYTVTTVRDAGRRRLNRTETTAVDTGRHYRHDLQRRRTLPNDTVQQYEQSSYGNGEQWFERREGETVSYYRGEIQFLRDEFAGEAAFYIEQYVNANRSWTERVRWNRALYYRVVGVGGTPPGLSQAEQYRFSMIVAPNGLVRRLDVRYRTEIGSQTETVRYSFWYEDVGSTIVVAPDWLDVAKTQAQNRSADGAP